MVLSTASLGDIPVPGERLCGLTWMQQHLWFSDAGLEQILAVAPETGQIVKRIACPGVRTDLANIDGRLLQIVGPAKNLRVIDPDTGQTVTEFPNPRPGAELCGLDVATEGVWMGYSDPQLIDLRRRSDFSLISSIQVEEAVAGLTVFGRFVAFANYSNAQISVLDPSLKQIVARINVTGNPTGLSSDGVRLWYCDYTNVCLRAVVLPGIAAEGC